MKRIGTTIVVALALGTLVLMANVGFASAACSGGSVIAYQDAQFGPPSITICDGSPVANLTSRTDNLPSGTWNDRISSMFMSGIACTRGAKFWKEANYKGGSWTVWGGSYTSALNLFYNDNFSSVSFVTRSSC